ncbi:MULTISPECIES: acetoin utilization AcuB family protein [unclassified Psychrobacillus]|uniref:acetoin utilization AcuB family protein n=1 Tax=unclassified Psychrobacillus TaxID=2636677 RepID=UPI001469F42E|nr:MULTISPECIES: acetoin utilization AcuB family protein [unclassified Psychrobacillus]MCM3359264.1 acetoin utilization AcuB family protein [Psychrobacillus sp. MER TA 171]NME07584.1 CBS domain-containing protein [Psychrobacillus sp. BL-248-WT-3]
MLVEEIMNTSVPTLTPSHTINDALKVLKEKRIRHIPIVNEEREVLGVVTDRDLKEATPSSLQDRKDAEILDMPLEKIMTKNPITGHPLDFVEETASIFYDNRIGCLPIVSQGKLVGMITESDLLYKFIELTGVHQPGSQMEIRVPNRPGVLFEISKVIYEQKVNLLSVLVYPDKNDSEYKILVLRVKTMNPLKLVQAVRDAGFEVLWPSQPGLNV